MNRIHKKHRPLKALLSIFLVLLLIVAGYVAYVFIAYNRLPNNLSLDIRGNESDPAQTGTEYSSCPSTSGLVPMSPIVASSWTEAHSPGHGQGVDF